MAVRALGTRFFEALIFCSNGGWRWWKWGWNTPIRSTQDLPKIFWVFIITIVQVLILSTDLRGLLWSRHWNKSATPPSGRSLRIRLHIETVFLSNLLGFQENSNFLGNGRDAFSSVAVAPDDFPRDPMQAAAALCIYLAGKSNRLVVAHFSSE